ncbi:MAG: helix-turn-helix domain-containing protein [Acidobacteria bacterium]|nr:helix-turn-helix domain-containing protein [Acidobacteriota bacterium]
MSSAGENLKNEREARGISLREISEHTKISVRFFKAIEEGKMELLPGGIFNKSFVRHYAAYIGLDEQQTVAEYFEEVRREQEAANPQVIASPKEGMLRPTGGNLSLIFAAIVLGVILLVGIAYALYRFSDREDVTASPVVASTAPESRSSEMGSRTEAILSAPSGALTLSNIRVYFCVSRMRAIASSASSPEQSFTISVHVLVNVG